MIDEVILSFDALTQRLATALSGTSACFKDPERNIPSLWIEYPRCLFVPNISFGLSYPCTNTSAKVERIVLCRRT
jgi:hypothetical protein